MKSKAQTAKQAKVLTDIPNIGKSIALDLRGLGVNTPADVAAMDPMAAYDALRTPMGQRHDPCLLDTFLAAKDFMNGGPAQPWWNFTAQRKAMKLFTTNAMLQQPKRPEPLGVKKCLTKS